MNTPFDLWVACVMRTTTCYAECAKITWSDLEKFLQFLPERLLRSHLALVHEGSDWLTKAAASRAADRVVWCFVLCLLRPVFRLERGPPWHSTVPESLLLTARQTWLVKASAGQALDCNTHIYRLPARVHQEQFVIIIEQHRYGQGVAVHSASTATERERDRATHLAPTWIDVIGSDQEATARDGDGTESGEEAPVGQEGKRTGP